MNTWPARIGAIVALIALVVVAVRVDRALRPTPDDDRVQVEYIDEVADAPDAGDYQRPDRVDLYNAPDSTDTRTDCIEVPTWLKKTRGTVSDSAARVLTTATYGPSRPTSSPVRGHTDLHLASLPYVLTPMQDGSPALTVTSQTATLTALSPRDGRTLRFEYDVPRPRLAVDLTVGSQVLPQTSVAYGRMEARYRVNDWVHVGANAGQAVTEDGRGWTGGVSIGLSLDQVWR